MHMRLLVYIALTALAFGCGSNSDSRESATESSPSSDEAPQGKASLTNEQLLQIARDAVAANDTWGERAEFETPKKMDDGSWSIIVWRRPATPGGHRLIIIDEQGVVTDYMHGR